MAKCKSRSRKKRTLGYEPRDVEVLGAIEVISRRVKNGSDGFDEVDPRDSYEAIVCNFPNRFAPEIQEIAKRRMLVETQRYRPTEDRIKLAELVNELRSRKSLALPTGVSFPTVVSCTINRICRDPHVQKYVVVGAKGRCELCDSEAPFVDREGHPYLEVHHMKPLAVGGSDQVSNAVALCPNCHRAIHFAADATKLSKKLYSKFMRLIPE
jgi:hypothetical protein